ncbi:matrixin family metalloprotease [Paenibacillus sp. GSMTC-2017]|uniref:matrixin family metalloprotease n=1 Tax=Paenibacillus sp. GSMTC-2017 TaxID=2794350 RepID=UPI0018D65E95|nr:matrixin family metalloprotease [Paenibacillus sp. GSMTC-2017]MBH5317782.1 matrixin family metalloprotease [Paenibacillus sp. GSMTC-2017]
MKSIMKNYGFRFLLFFSLVVVFSFSSTVNGANYILGGKMENGISDGQFRNNASPSVTVHGVTINMEQTAEGAMNAWNNLTEAYYADWTVNPTFNSYILAYGTNYGNTLVNGWAELYAAETSTDPMNPGPGGAGSITEDWYYAVVYGNAYHMTDGTPMTYDQRKAVYMHEIGHALGLDHASVGVASVMRDEAQRHANKWYTLQPDDINGVNALY